MKTTLFGRSLFLYLSYMDRSTINKYVRSPPVCCSCLHRGDYDRFDPSDDSERDSGNNTNDDRHIDIEQTGCYNAGTSQTRRQ